MEKEDNNIFVEWVRAVSRNYQLIIYVYAAVGASELTYPFSRMGCSVECITAHSYVRARVPTAANGRVRGLRRGFFILPPTEKGRRNPPFVTIHP